MGPFAGGMRRFACVVTVALAAAGPLAAPVAAEPVWLEVSQAISGTDQRSGQAVVNFILTTAGREVFARFTAAHVGRRIDIRVDGKTWLRPVIQEPVNGGVGQIPVPTVEAGRVLARRLATEGARLEVEAVE
ncbi:SecDF P1 head subdomain-containing protein [Rhodoplanes sp. SY1]|uniref:SecDF P1 head subdomain-containing protein n=1 Tax=Rhodoplanes sp. SY1 TaxID=3166646 RepID=UPI0038B4920F